VRPHHDGERFSKDTGKTTAAAESMTIIGTATIAAATSAAITTTIETTRAQNDLQVAAHDLGKLPESLGATLLLAGQNMMKLFAKASWRTT